MTICIDRDHIVLEGLYEGNEKKAEIPGVEKINGGTKLRKVYPARRFLIDPIQIAAVIETHREGDDVVILGVSGFSLLNQERCRQLNIRLNSYETLLVSMVRNSIFALRNGL